MSWTREQVEKAVKAKGYKWFDSGKDYELNIVGIRNSTTGLNVTDKFDDWITVSYKVGGKPYYHIWPATTDPGKYYAEVRLGNSGGTARMVPGQYTNAYAYGKHPNGGKYDALRQVGNIKIYRDLTLNNTYDESKITEGAGFGVNIHRASATGTSQRINNWSAGCQVFSTNSDIEEFLTICRASRALYGNKFTYTLIESKDITGRPSEETPTNPPVPADSVTPVTPPPAPPQCTDEQYNQIPGGKEICRQCQEKAQQIQQINAAGERASQLEAAKAVAQREFPGLEDIFRYIEMFPEMMMGNIRCDADGNKSNAFGASPGSLAMKADLTMPGVNGMRIGELFWIDRIPAFYKAFGAFQIMSIEDTIDINGWQTKVHSQFNYLGEQWKRSIESLADLVPVSSPPRTELPGN